jgi:PD-(D/E)XK endonuclease
VDTLSGFPDRGGTWPRLVKASGWGPEDRRFKSCRPDSVAFFEQTWNVSTWCYRTGMVIRSSPSTWSDTQLAEAVAASTNWRGVMRELGLNVMSAGAIRIVRRHVVRLGLDTSHFRGKRRWSDAQLRRAVSESQSWDEVLEALGLAVNGGGMRTHVKSHAIRLNVNFGHLEADTPALDAPRLLKPHVRHLREAGASIAAAWFTLCGSTVLFPIEPAIYDLVVSIQDRLSRVQVKTTTHYSKNGWMITVGRRPYSIRKDTPLIPYDPDLIDYFFMVDGDLNLYLIPSRVIAGRVAILLRTYARYVVGNASGLFGADGARGMLRTTRPVS